MKTQTIMKEAPMQNAASAATPRTLARLLTVAAMSASFLLQTAAASVTISPSLGGDDTARIQHTIDNSTGEVHFQAGVYRLNGPIALRANRTYSGEGSWDPRQGSVLQQGVSNVPIFSVDGPMSVIIAGLTFDATVGAINAKGIAACVATPIFTCANSAGALLETSTLRGNHFLVGLAEGIDVPMVLTRIEQNQFGLHGGGAIAAKRRHIHSVSTGQDIAVNANWMVGNRFSSANGSESVLFESGLQLHVVGNDFEGNEADTTLRAHGMLQVIVEGNWFERNHGEALMTFSRAARSLVGNDIVRLENNYYNLSGFGAPTKCNGQADQGNCSIFAFEEAPIGDATLVYMGYERAAYFRPVADITSSRDAGFLTITGAVCFKGYSGKQAGAQLKCP